MMKAFFSFLFVCSLFISFAQSKNAYIRISLRDPRYLEYSDGTPYIPIGLNLIGMGRLSDTKTGLAETEDLLKKLSRNKGNYFRLWFGDSFYDIEHTKSSEYDEVKASERLDKVIQLAAKYNLHIKATIEHFRHFNTAPAWSAKPLHHVKNGGTATSIKDFFTGNASKELYKKKLDWYAQRYAANPTVYVWELWNEVNTVQGSGNSLAEAKAQYEWTKEMLPELRKRFPYRITTQSLGSFNDRNDRETFRAFTSIPENDLAQVHRYIDVGADLQICHGPVDVMMADAVNELRAFNLNKPVLLSEGGAVEAKHSGLFKHYATDKAGILLHDVLFAPFFTGAAGGGQFWHWRDYIVKNDLWYHFRRFYEVVKKLDPPAEHFKTSIQKQGKLRIYSLKGAQTILLWCRDTTNTWITELQLGKAPEVINNLDLNLQDYLEKPASEVRIYDPWRNKWTKAKVKNNTVILPAFSRSIVVRIKYK
jgi:hypothetical protein